MTDFDVVVGAEGGISEPFRPTHGDPENWYDQSVNGNWTNISVSRADQPPSPPVHPVLYDQRLLRWNLATPEVRLQLGEAVSPAFKSEIAFRRLGAASLPARHVAPAVFKRAPVGELRMAATPKAITSPLLAARLPFEHTLLGVNNKFRRPIGERTPLAVDPSGALVPGMPAPVPPPPPQPPVSSDAFSIMVGISIVKVRRPWLSDGLLNLPNWFVPNIAKGFFSGGTGPDDLGILPVLPVACVLIRNLSIRAQWSEDDQKNVESSTHLGVFGLQGRTYDRNTATLTVPGMQSVAWICDPFPVLPPADPPAS